MAELVLQEPLVILLSVACLLPTILLPQASAGPSSCVGLSSRRRRTGSVELVPRDTGGDCWSVLVGDVAHGWVHSGPGGAQWRIE